MKIAIATNDRETIARRTGRAREFAFIEIDDNGNIVNVYYEENQHKHDDEDEHHHEPNHRKVTGYGQGLGRGRGQGRGLGRGLGHGQGRHHHDDETEEHHHHHHGEHHHNEVIDQLKEVDMFLVRAVGKYLRQDLIDGKIPFQRVNGEKLDEIVQNYVKSLQA